MAGFFCIFPFHLDMKKAGIIFPDQLFEQVLFSQDCDMLYLVEESLFFRQYPFHKQKLAFQRASMKFYEDYLLGKGKKVTYVEAHQSVADVRQLIADLSREGLRVLEIVDVTDNWLEKRIREAAGKANIFIECHETPKFFNSKPDVSSFFEGKKTYRQTDFYKWQRVKWNILMEGRNQPVGGKWTFDNENREKYPAGKMPPAVVFPAPNKYYLEAIGYTDRHFGDNYGQLSGEVHYPCTFSEAEQFMEQFLEQRFHGYGTYQDAIVSGQNYLHHSLLSPLLNSGLLKPSDAINRALEFAAENKVPLNALEGFVRQILGWREFIRGVYEVSGSRQRTRNFWGFKRKIPESFWKGKTGLAPVDQAIGRLLHTGYNHHIERLMVLGNVMLLSEIDPDEVYRWFMTMYIDAYDWVMVPNVYGMSQFADGGLMSTKPYVSGSNYLRKMSNYPPGEWQRTWDALFWRFLHVHREFFRSNPRLGLLVRSFDNMEAGKKKRLLDDAEAYLGK